jgi:hypothetical protein
MRFVLGEFLRLGCGTVGQDLDGQQVEVVQAVVIGWGQYCCSS